MATRSKTVQKRKNKWGTRDGFAYLTKRLLVANAQSAGKVAARNAMEVMGYLVKERGGWVVRTHSDGRVEQIEKLQTT